jgi:poly(A) polymerase
MHLRALDALDAHVRVGEIPSDAVLLATLLSALPRQGAPRGPIPRPEPREAGPGGQPGAADAAEAPDAEAVEDEELDQELEALHREIDEPDPPGDPAHAPLLEGALRAEEPHDERLATNGMPAFSMGGAPAQPWSLPAGVVPPEIVLAEMVRTARLPRRIAERARLILAAQPLLSGERRRRRFSPQAFARQSIFPEALAVFELSVAATGRGADQLARWQGVFAGQDFSTLEPDEERPDRSRSPDSTRRRRRRGRGGPRRPRKSG